MSEPAVALDGRNGCQYYAEDGFCDDGGADSSYHDCYEGVPIAQTAAWLRGDTVMLDNPESSLAPCERQIAMAFVLDASRSSAGGKVLMVCSLYCNVQRALCVCVTGDQTWCVRVRCVSDISDESYGYTNHTIATTRARAYARVATRPASALASIYI